MHESIGAARLGSCLMIGHCYEYRTDTVTTTTSRVRIDIQVLRAAAVLAVILGHFWPQRFPGGFTGVDVFFVISGFLITSHIISEVSRSSRLNLVGFWMRRIRRILPAAMSVIAVTAVTVLWIGSPDQIDILSRHVIASSLSAENLLLSWDAVDYNHRDDITSPLQHFWSLAVEEQFYLVWPIVIAITLAFTRLLQLPLERFRRVMLTAIGVLTVASFVYASALDHTNPATYYDPFARAWELGIGASIALAGSTVAARFSSRIRQLAVLAAWTVIVGMSVVPGLENLVPGLGVVPSVIATGIIIICAAPMSSFRLPAATTAISGLVWLGDRSYSAYLWHWPFLILAPLVIGLELTMFHKIVVLAFVFAASALSFRFIEQPFRLSQAAIIRRPILLAPISVALTTLLILGTLFATDGATKSSTAVNVDDILPPVSAPLPEDASPEYPLVSPFCFGAGAAVFDCPPSTEVLFGSRSLPSNPPESPTCTPVENDHFFDCVLGDPDAATAVAVVGDSHAKALWVAWDDLGKRHGIAIHSFFRAGCPYSDGRQQECGERNSAVRDRLFAGEFDFAILVQSVDQRRRQPDARERTEFASTYRNLEDNGVSFVVVKDNPGIGEDDKDCFSRNFRDPSGCAVSRADGFSVPDFAFEVAVEGGHNTIDFSEIYCDDTLCPLVLGGVRVYRDYRHITTIFGKTLAPFLYNELTTLGLISANE